jgi:uncharacterized repeat protein (TIGR03806 family)
MPLVAEVTYASKMRTFSLGCLCVFATACGDDPKKPVPAPFGLDTRPANTTCIASDRPVVDTGVALQRQWRNITFTTPIYLVQAPGDDTQWYVVEKGGTIRKFAATATMNSQVSDFANVSVIDDGEAGLLGFAFDPSWQTNHKAYLSYTRAVTNGDPQPVCPAPDAGNPFTSVVARFQLGGDGKLTPVGEILKVGQPYGNHNGGNIQFGKDGQLYFGLGDGGSGDDPCGSGQNPNSLLGKMLRLDVNANGTIQPEIWASGLRNPWRWSFDRDTGDLWLGDVGQGTWEEIDKIEQGGNYGWNTCEGFHRRGSDTELCRTPGLREPVVEHSQTQGEAHSITGGYVYRGTAIPGLVGTYIYGDFATGTIWALTYDVNGRAVPKKIAQAAQLASFGQGNDGELYTVQINGIISKLVPSGTPGADTFPDLLSQTGCVDPHDPTKPASGLIPYDVNSPLWSDGAAKERFFAIPDGKTIEIGAEGDWDLPIGSVAVKNFSVDNKRVETRLFMRHSDGNWAGYSYEWNDEGTDATLLAGSLVKSFSNGTMWSYPSREQCLQCHSRGAGGTIGLETAQLNGDAVYPSTNRLSNQLATLDHIGLFSAPLSQAPSDLPRLVDPAGTDAAPLRARSYLHANCSHCHRPMGGGQGMMDLRYSQPLADTKTCNADNTQGNIGDSTKLVVPGDPAASILSLRIHGTDNKRMPPVAVSITDPTGTAVIDEWITSLTTCP